MLGKQDGLKEYWWGCFVFFQCIFKALPAAVQRECHWHLCPRCHACAQMSRDYSDLKCRAVSGFVKLTVWSLWLLSKIFFRKSLLHKFHHLKKTNEQWGIFGLEHNIYSKQERKCKKKTHKKTVWGERGVVKRSIECVNELRQLHHKVLYQKWLVQEGRYSVHLFIHLARYLRHHWCPTLTELGEMPVVLHSGISKITLG